MGDDEDDIGVDDENGISVDDEYGDNNGGVVTRTQVGHASISMMLAVASALMIVGGVAVAGVAVAAALRGSVAAAVSVVCYQRGRTCVIVLANRMVGVVVAVALL